MSEHAKGRQITNIYDAKFRVYDMEGPKQEDMEWLPLTYNDDANGCYAIRMQAGAETIWHEHRGMEDFLILEGDLIEPDGTKLGPGDFVSYPPGSQHNSRSETGCFLIGFDWGKPKQSG
ncbi:MAG: cupin domain-containing protein [Pseudomonadota bacterium]